MLQTIKIIVSGKVQGVFYRHHTKQKTLQLGINGTVRNLSNGEVEVIATGTKEQIDALADWCKQGPSRANVTNVEAVEIPLQHFDSFEIVG